MNDNTQILIICNGLGGDGGAVANVAWQQAIGLSKRSEVCLICDGISTVRQQKIESEKLAIQVRSFKSPSLSWLRRFAHLPSHIAWIIQAIRKLRDQIKSCPEKTSIVICHSHPIAATVGWFVKKFHPSFMIMIAHGDIFHRPKGSYSTGLTWLFKRTTASAYRLADRCIALSPVMRERIESYDIPKERIALIPNGIDGSELGLTDQANINSIDLESNPLRLLFVGRFDHVKGVDILINACALLKKSNTKFHLDLIGGGTSKTINELKASIHHRGLESEITFIESIARQHLAKHYMNSHLVIVPSRDDPLPTVVLEAMVCGRPIIGSDLGGIQYMIEDGLNGRLFEACNAELLAEIITELNADRSKLKNLAHGAIQRSKEFSWSANIIAIEKLIE